jgi:peroxiredoxin
MRFVGRKFLLVPIFLLATLVFGCASRSAPGAWVGKPAPSTRVQLLDGDYVPLAAYRGKNVVLVFWAQWCAKSKQMLERLNDLAARRSSRDDIVFLVVSVDKEEDLSKVKERIALPAMQRFTHAFSGAAEYDEAFRVFSCSELPQVFVIDPRGIVIGSGSNTDVVELALPAW